MNFVFPYFKTNNTHVRISTNGFILFYTSLSCCSVTRPTSSNSIAAYNYDLITTSASGKVYYRSITQTNTDLTTIQNEINQYLTTNFVAKNAFLITYDNILSYTDRTDTAKFQIILSTDSQRSFLTINYVKCLLRQTSLPLSEFDCLDASNRFVQNFINNPCTSSNVNVPGKWIFNISSECNFPNYV